MQQNTRIFIRAFDAEAESFSGRAQQQEQDAAGRCSLAAEGLIVCTPCLAASQGDTSAPPADVHTIESRQAAVGDATRAKAAGRQAAAGQ